MSAFTPMDVRAFLAEAGYVVEEFTAQEEQVLLQHFTNLDLPVFALKNLPEVVKGALFARYSRSAKSLRRLFLDEFASEDLSADVSLGEDGVGGERAAVLYKKVFAEYGDDSVAQLGGVHVACEQVSNVLTKVLERPRLASFLEQSTRYVPYDAKVTTTLGERYRYHLDPNVLASPVAEGVASALDAAFDDYQELYHRMVEHYSQVHPQGSDSEGVWRSAVRAKALDSVRGLLPAATRSNLGIYASGQAYEALVLRLRSHPLPEAQLYGELLLQELRKVIPSFLTRIDVPERGVAWSQYLADVRERTKQVATSLRGLPEPSPSSEVVLTEWDPLGEGKVLAAALYPHSSLSLSQLEEAVTSLSRDEVETAFSEVVGERSNRRHRPGRGFEATDYCFDVVSDYGAFRDLQRHRLLTVEWQALSPENGYVLPDAVVAAGGEELFRSAMDRSARAHALLVEADLEHLAPYVVSLAYRIRFLMRMNAREAMHVIELRTAPAGHPSYRRVCQRMHSLIEEKHPLIAAAMSFTDHSDPDGERLERLDSERRAERRREAGSY